VTAHKKAGLQGPSRAQLRWPSVEAAVYCIPGSLAWKINALSPQKFSSRMKNPTK